MKLYSVTVRQTYSDTEFSHTATASQRGIRLSPIRVELIHYPRSNRILSPVSKTLKNLASVLNLPKIRELILHLRIRPLVAGTHSLHVGSRILLRCRFYQCGELRCVLGTPASQWAGRFFSNQIKPSVIRIHHSGGTHLAGLGAQRLKRSL